MNESFSNQIALLSMKLDEIEAELKRVGLWSDEVIDPFESLPLASTRTYMTASSFEVWLQFTFLPNAREAIRAEDLPDNSQVGLMALRQWDYLSHVPEGQQLIILLNEFDNLINELSRTT